MSGVLPTAPANPSCISMPGFYWSSSEGPAVDGVDAGKVAGAQQQLELLGDLPGDAQRAFGVGEALLVDHVDVLREALADADDLGGRSGGGPAQIGRASC